MEQPLWIVVHVYYHGLVNNVRAKELQFRRLEYPSLPLPSLSKRFINQIYCYVVTPARYSHMRRLGKSMSCCTRPLKMAGVFGSLHPRQTHPQRTLTCSLQRYLSMRHGQGSTFFYFKIAELYHATLKVAACLLGYPTLSVSHHPIQAKVAPRKLDPFSLQHRLSMLG